MNRKTIEFGVGLFVLVGLIAVAYLALKIGGSGFLATDTYQLNAAFSRASGVNPGSRIEIAGVQVGTVASVELDRENFVAVVTMELPNGLVLDDDTIASIKTSGLIGDRYIQLSPGGSGIELQPGDSFFSTEPALDIEDLISRFAFGTFESKEEE